MSFCQVRSTPPIRAQLDQNVERLVLKNHDPI